MTEVEIGIYTHRWSPLQVGCIESIASHTKFHQYSILVQQTLGTCAQNMNRIWRRFTAPYVILMDEDVQVLQDDWLTSLIDMLESDPTIGVLGCRSTRVAGTFPEPHKPPITWKRWIPAYVMAFKLSRVEKFLHFDEAIPGQMGMTDVDACFQISGQGLQIATNEQVVVYHPARDDDETRIKEKRPLTSQQRVWYPQQCAYMINKWGETFRKCQDRGS